MKINRNKFTLNKMTIKLDEIVEKYTSNIPQQVGLNLPKLEKVDKNNTTEGSETYDSSSGVVKKKVGFVVTNTNNEVFIIDKWLTIVYGK